MSTADGPISRLKEVAQYRFIFPRWARHLVYAALIPILLLYGDVILGYLLLGLVIILIIAVALLLKVGGPAITVAKWGDRAGVTDAPWWLEPLDLITKPARLLDTGVELLEVVWERLKR